MTKTRTFGKTPSKTFQTFILFIVMRRQDLTNKKIMTTTKTMTATQTIQETFETFFTILTIENLNA